MKVIGNLAMISMEDALPYFGRAPRSAVRYRGVHQHTFLDGRMDLFEFDSAEAARKIMSRYTNAGMVEEELLRKKLSVRRFIGKWMNVGAANQTLYFWLHEWKGYDALQAWLASNLSHSASAFMQMGYMRVNFESVEDLTLAKMRWTNEENRLGFVLTPYTSDHA